MEPLDKWEEILKVDGTALSKVLKALPGEAREKVDECRNCKESISLSVKKNKIDIEEE